MAKRLYDPYLHKVVDESPADPASKLMYDTALCRLRFVDTTLGDRVYDPLMKKFRLGALLNPLANFAIDINSVFADRALLPLDIPSPVVTDTDKSVVHPDVWDFGKVWNGYRYWMAYTPLPEANPNDFENPCIIASNDGESWVEPIGILNPIYPKGALNYQADTELYYEAGKLYLIWRGRDNDNNIKLCYGYSTDGINWSEKAFINIDSVIDQNTALISPCIIKDSDKYILYGVNISSATVEGYSIEKYTSDDLLGEYTLERVLTLDASLTALPPRAGQGAAAWYPWHINANKLNGVTYMIIMTRKVNSVGQQLYIAASSDDITFKFAKYPIMARNYDGYLKWDTAFYRSALIPCVENDQFCLKHWYGGMYNTYNGYPYKIGYNIIKPYTGWLNIDESTNTIKDSRADELIVANAHENGYIFCDDFNRVQTDGFGLGVASDGTIYSEGASAAYWKVSGDYAYLSSAVWSFMAFDLTKEYNLTMIASSASRIIYVKYIDANNYIGIDGSAIILVIGGSLVRKSQVYFRSKLTDICEYNIIFNSTDLIFKLNGYTELQYTFVLSDFADQAQMDNFLNETTFRIRLSNTTDKIFDITAKSI